MTKFDNVDFFYKCKYIVVLIFFFSYVKKKQCHLCQARTLSGRLFYRCRPPKCLSTFLFNIFVAICILRRRHYTCILRSPSWSIIENIKQQSTVNLKCDPGQLALDGRTLYGPIPSIQ